MTWKAYYPPVSELEESLASNLGQMLSTRAAQTPDQLALVFFEHDEQLTYAELSNHVRRVAGALKKVGVGKGTHVGLIMPNRLEFPVTWLALAWIGASTLATNLLSFPTP